MHDEMSKNFNEYLHMNQWMRMWLKGLKFTLSYNLRENLYKRFCHHKIYLRCITVLQTIVGSVESMKGHFIMHGELVIFLAKNAG